jgi:hypothetical protein
MWLISKGLVIKMTYEKPKLVYETTSEILASGQPSGESWDPAEEPADVPFVDPGVLRQWQDWPEIADVVVGAHPKKK